MCKYISGMWALNTRPKSFTNTSGDWHSVNYFSYPERIRYYDSENSPFGEWGIDSDVRLPNPNIKGGYTVANHIRALLDLIVEGNFAAAGGMRRDFIGTDEYDNVVFEKVEKLYDTENWHNINLFMLREYGKKWLYETKGTKYELAS